jgi:hypothetical protein
MLIRKRSALFSIFRKGHSQEPLQQLWQGLSVGQNFPFRTFFVLRIEAWCLMAKMGWLRAETSSCWEEGGAVGGVGAVGRGGVAGAKGQPVDAPRCLCLHVQYSCTL